MELKFEPKNILKDEVTPELSYETLLARVSDKISESLFILESVAKKYPQLAWEVGFSGGKDSSVICHLVLEYVSQALVDGSPLPPKIYIMFCDTYLDLPILRSFTLSTLKSIKEYSAKYDGLIDVVIVKPDENEDYFTMMIDKGYPAPHYRFRWCMDRLKINPSLDFLYKIKDFAMISGVRMDESDARSKLLKKRNQNSPISVIGNRLTIAPILTWKIEDVWNFLELFTQPWNGESYRNLFEIYRLGDNLEGCWKCLLVPNSRFGCWICTVIRKDRLLMSLSAFSDEYKLLLEKKEEIRAISRKRIHRVLDEKGNFRKLNKKGRIKIIHIIAELLLTIPNSLEAYTTDEILNEKIMRWLLFAYEETADEIFYQAYNKIT